MKKLQLLFILFVFGCSNAVAGNTAPVNAFVSSTSDKVIQIVKSSSQNNAKETQLTALFEQVMDIDWIGRFTIGSYWNSLSDAQKGTYLTSYRKFLVSSYVPIFKDYNGQSFKVKSVKDMGNDSYLVETEITAPNSQVASKVEYRIKQTPSGYKVRDIIAEGVSMINTQRSDFGSVLTESGFDGLNNKLLSKVDSAS
ncbi:MAG: phospholipid-binding protein MlaC [Rickettsiales bacterium]